MTVKNCWDYYQSTRKVKKTLRTISLTKYLLSILLDMHVYNA
jgi:hypothetical protein